MVDDRRRFRLHQLDICCTRFSFFACLLQPIKGPMSADCQLILDRAYMKQISGMYIPSQFPK
jgi:hypothetical protein